MSLSTCELKLYLMIPKISVIVPVYNVEKYLPRCIDSILSQTFKDFELLLIDDGSPDNCGRICDEYAQKDCRVRVFHKLNGGVSSARNLGLDNAQGEWIAFIDSDDYVDENYLAELLKVTELEGTDFVVILNAIKKYTENRYIVLTDESLVDLFSLYEFHRNGCPWGKLYKHNIIRNKNLRFNKNIHLGEDVIFAILYLLEIETVVVISSDKYFYERERPHSLTKTLGTYECELLGYNELSRVIALIKKKIKFDAHAMIGLESLQKYFVDRIIESIKFIPNRRDRLQRLEKLDLTLFCKYKGINSWKEDILYYLLVFRCFFLYDLLVYRKNNGC